LKIEKDCKIACIDNNEATTTMYTNKHTVQHQAVISLLDVFKNEKLIYIINRNGTSVISILIADRYR